MLDQDKISSAKVRSDQDMSCQDQVWSGHEVDSSQVRLGQDSQVKSSQ